MISFPTSLIVPGNWTSVSGGKWHLLATDRVPESPLETVVARCGANFQQLNVSGGEAPPCTDYHVCKHCAETL